MRTVFVLLAVCAVLVAAQDPVAPIRGGKTGKQNHLYPLCPLLLCTPLHCYSDSGTVRSSGLQ